jgi:hypothetical protein
LLSGSGECRGAGSREIVKRNCKMENKSSKTRVAKKCIEKYISKGNVMNKIIN